MSATATTEKKYLKWYQKLAYGSGDLASNCSYGLVSSFVLLYLTGTLGLDSAIIGSLMLASKVLDGISDVIFGTLIDRTHSKLGKARPWMLFGQVAHDIVHDVDGKDHQVILVVGWLLKLGGFVGTATVQSESAIRMIFNLYIIPSMWTPVVRVV